LEVFEAIKMRRSARSYLKTPVPDKLIKKILEAARLAPSAANIQPWHFILVKNPNKRKELAKACRFGKFLAESPVVIVGIGNKKASPKWHAIDTAIAMEHMVLTATAEGLGTCWVGSFNEKRIRELLEIPRDYNVVALLAIGYPREKPDYSAKILHFIRKRKKLEEIVSVERYGEPYQG